MEYGIYQTYECLTGKIYICPQEYKEKLLKADTITWFNKMCQLKHLIPKYKNITTSDQKLYGF